MGTTQECCIVFRTNCGSSILQSSNCKVTYLPSHKPSNLDEQFLLGTAKEIRTHSQFLDSYTLTYQQNLAFISSVLTLDAVLEAYQLRSLHGTANNVLYSIHGLRTDSVYRNRVRVLNILVLLLACSQNGICYLQIIVI